MIRFEYFFLEALTIIATLGFGGFLLHESLSDPGQPWTLMGGSLLLGIGVVLASLVIRSVFRQLNSRPN